jgi:hypothetical protein
MAQVVLESLDDHLLEARHLARHQRLVPALWTWAGFRFCTPPLRGRKACKIAALCAICRATSYSVQLR